MPGNAVVLVPGFLGSTLYTPTTLAGNVRLWLSPTVLAGLFGRLALPTDDNPDLPPPGAPALIGGGPLGPYYGLLGAYLDSRGWFVVSPYADWRRPLAFDAANLVVAIKQSAQSGPVRIVCHSRGGLLTRIALGTLAAEGNLAMVARVVGLGVPHVGSLNAVMAIAGYAALLDSLEGLSRRHHGYWGPTLPHVPARQVLRSWPALYQLLPDPTRSWLSAEVRAAIYRPLTWARSTLPVYFPHLAAAAAAWPLVPDVPAGFDWVDVAGYGVVTATDATSPSVLPNKGELSFSGAGDGTVPEVSAHQGERRLVRTPTAHDMLPNDGRLWPLIHAALNGQLSEDVTLAGSVLYMTGTSAPSLC